MVKTKTSRKAFSRDGGFCVEEYFVYLLLRRRREGDNELFFGSRSPLTKFLCFKPRLSNYDDDVTGWPRLAM